MITIKFEALTKKEIEQRVAQFMSDYPPVGYGTRAGEIVFADDVWSCEIRRSSSCE